ncbi:MAG: alkaline phosphatase D family protein [Bdellovibrionota bacterium]
MKIILGPIVKFCGQDRKNSMLRFKILAIIDGKAPVLKFSGAGASGQDTNPKCLHSKNNLKFYSYDLQIRQSSESEVLTYILGKRSWEINIPGKLVNPKMSFISCNGFSSVKEIAKVKKKNNLWKASSNSIHKGILDVHANDPIHLLIMGGDQVYADSIWHEIPELKEWQELDFDARVKYPVSEKLALSIDDFYFNLYSTRWNQEEVQTALATIPSIMMWDDHDIIDGWGSHDEKLQQCPVFKEIFKNAKQYFSILQQQILPNAVKPDPYLSESDYSFLVHYGKYDILALDLRSQRNLSQVIHEESWQEIKNAMNHFDDNVKHLLVISSIPVVHPDMSWIDSAWDFLLPGRFDSKFELLDDLRDHWNSRPHQGERLKLIHNLYNVCSKNIRVTILSGDVHVAALGKLEWQRGGLSGHQRVINQLTSSGVVHPAPPAFMNIILEMLAKKEYEFDRGLTAQMLKFPASNERILLGRNWLELNPTDDDRIWGAFHLEEEKHPYLKAIHPCI